MKVQAIDPQNSKDLKHSWWHRYCEYCCGTRSQWM